MFLKLFVNFEFVMFFFIVFKKILVIGVVLYLWIYFEFRYLLKKFICLSNLCYWFCFNLVDYVSFLNKEVIINVNILKGCLCDIFMFIFLFWYMLNMCYVERWNFLKLGNIIFVCLILMIKNEGFVISFFWG